VANYIHGKSASFIYGATDLSPWVTEATGSQAVDVADTSHFGSNSKTYIVGQDDGTINFSGLYDATVGASNAVLSAAVAAGTDIPITFAPEGVTIGAYALMALAKETQYEINTVISDVEKITGQTQVSGGIHHGVILKTLASDATSTNYTSVDNAVATSAGGFAQLHVLTNSIAGGNLIVKVQHSVDNSTWVDLATFTTVAAGPGVSSEGLSFSGTVNRYLRAITTRTGTGSTVAVVSAARN